MSDDTDSHEEGFDPRLADLLKIAYSKKVGSDSFESKNAKYVLHTSTIPMSLNSPDPKADHCLICEPTKERVFIRSNCPCQLVDCDEESLIPIHWNRFLNKFHQDLNPDSGMVKDDDLNLDEVMICIDHVSAIDEKYGAGLREKTGCTGWSHISNIEQLCLAIKGTWIDDGSTYDGKTSIEWIRASVQTHTLDRLKHAIKHAAYSADGLYKKLSFASPLSLTRIEVQNELPAIFDQLLYDFLKDVKYDVTGRNVSGGDTLYKLLMEFKDYAKENFRREGPYSRRLDWLQLSEPKWEKLPVSVHIVCTDLYVEAYTWIQNRADDYTKSIRWITRVVKLARGRAMGNLPKVLSSHAGDKFMARVTRPVIPLEEGFTNFSAAAIDHAFDEINYSRDPAEQKDLIKGYLNDVFTPVKPTASVDSTVVEGGSQEDERALLRLAIENAWNIPIRDLWTGEVTDSFTVSEEDETTHLKEIFWICFQITLHVLDPKVYDIFAGAEKWAARFYHARTLHINEYEKLRDLVKVSTVMSVVFNIGAKISFQIIGQLPEHYDGLLGHGNIAWCHEKRLDPRADDAGFVYNKLNGSISSTVIAHDKDWSTSSDWIKKLQGMTNYANFVKRTGFPDFYAQVIQAASYHPLKVTESKVILEDGNEVQGFINYEITEGFMMGIPDTKNKLHLQLILGFNGGRLILRRLYKAERQILPAAMPRLSRLPSYQSIPIIP